MTLVAMRLMKYRSWEMNTIVPGNPARAASRTSRETRSRWLVGSSRHRSAAGRVSILARADRKSTRLNSSHDQISYAVFCLKKKKRSIHNNADMACVLVASNADDHRASLASYVEQTA